MDIRLKMRRIEKRRRRRRRKKVHNTLLSTIINYSRLIWSKFITNLSLSKTTTTTIRTFETFLPRGSERGDIFHPRCAGEGGGESVGKNGARVRSGEKWKER